MPQLVISALGPDKPGIVGQLTGHLHSASANILDSRMVNLRGQFAIILLIEADEPSITALTKNLPAAASDIGISLTLAPQEPSAARPTPGVPYRIKTYSLDQPGIVHRVTDVLRQHNVNIEELEARQDSAPFAGTPLFTMELRVTVPKDVPLKTLRTQLESECEKINCDLDMEPG